MNKEEFKEHPEVKEVRRQAHDLGFQQGKLEQQLLVTKDPELRSVLLRQLIEINEKVLVIAQQLSRLANQLGLE